LSSPECHAPVGVEHETSGDFLTLGISSRSYPTSSQYEVNSKESMSPDMVHQAKRVINSEAEVDNSLHLQISNRHQVQFVVLIMYMSRLTVFSSVPKLFGKILWGERLVCIHCKLTDIWHLEGC